MSRPLSPAPFAGFLVLYTGAWLASPFAGRSSLGLVAVHAAIHGGILIAQRAAAPSPAVWRGAQLCFALVLGAQLLGMSSDSPVIATVGRAAGIGSVGLALVTLFRSVAHARHSGSGEVLAAVSNFLLMGLGWAFAYEICCEVEPASFAGLLSQDQGERFAELVYYSYVTLTTLGYGDIRPTGLVSRNLATMEAVTGQLFLIVLLARLVTAPALASHDSE